MNVTVIQRMTGNYYKQTHTNKLENLREIGERTHTTYLDWVRMTKDNLNREITKMKIKDYQQSPRPDGFIAEFYQTFKN